MEKQQRRFNEEMERLQKKMAVDAKAHQEQMTNMTMASMQKAEQDRRAMMQENQATKALFEEMQRRNEELEKTTELLKENVKLMEAKLDDVSNPGFFLEALRVVVPVVVAILGKLIK